tara:strand:- start:8 stop:562 length:555 start_codon:yes stop_codon:yes gene_type:complete
MRLKTKRLVLRDIKKSDVKSIIENVNNLNVSRYLLAVAHPYTEEDAGWWINHCAEQQKKKPRESYNFGIVIRPGRSVVGGIGIDQIDRKKGSAHIGYWIGEKYWRKGYVSEAAKRIIDYAFEDLGLRKITIPAFIENKGSNGLIKKLGFRFVRVKKKGGKAKSTGKVHDENIYEMTVEEWGKRK